MTEIYDSACKSNFDSIEDYRKHTLTSTHLIESMRQDINRMIDSLEMNIWALEKEKGKVD